MDIEIRFPAIQYTLADRKTGARSTSTLLENSGELHRAGRWPRKEWYVPGGILDSDGHDIPIIDLANWRPIPTVLRPIDYFFGGLIAGGHYRVDYVFGEPMQLALQEFKNRLCQLLAKERRSHSGGVGFRARQRDVQAATTFEEAVRAV